MLMRSLAYAAAVATVTLFGTQAWSQSTENFTVLQNPAVSTSLPALSPPLRSLPVVDLVLASEVELPVGPTGRAPPVLGFVDPVQQDWTAGYRSLVPGVSGPYTPTQLLGFDGMSATGYIPPDPTGAVGPNHYIQMVNASVSVFDKSTGTRLHGPVSTASMFAALGGVCASTISGTGDGIVLHDSIADRWVITQLGGYLNALPDHTADSHECVAVSTTNDPLGTYSLYQFGPYHFLNDYPKLGVWPDAYYVTYNMFFDTDGVIGAFDHATACALDRNAMIQGMVANQQCVDLPNSPTRYGSLLPADLDGATRPPAGAPNYLAALIGTTSIGIWQYTVNWANPAASTLAGPIVLQVAPFNDAPANVPQAGTTQQLDPIGERLMFRLAYRNLGDHESLVANHTVALTVAGTNTQGARWYEIRLNNGMPTLLQQSTYAPDTDYRFTGSAAMDQSGNIALGFSLSSSTRFPEIRYTGRIAIDTLNSMTQGDNTAAVSGGPQTVGSNRWGDYSTMCVDPVDDCTFWYTTEYQPSAGNGNWTTRMQSFRLPGCPTTWFSISASPTSTTATTTVSTTAAPGFTGAVTLSTSGLPSGASSSFNPSAIPAPGSSTLTLNPGTSVAGTYPITITGTEGGVSRSVVITWNDPGCTPTASCAGKNCGTVDNGCGVILDCGTCTGGQTCSNNVCSCPPNFLFCSAQCVDGTRNPNCGRCGFSCPRGEICGRMPDGTFDCTCSGAGCN